MVNIKIKEMGIKNLSFFKSKTFYSILIFIFSLQIILAGNIIVTPNGIQSDNYYSSDGTAGLTQEIPFRGTDGNNYTMSIKNGLIVSTSSSNQSGGGNSSKANWWNPSYNNCKNITITTSLSRENAIMEYNITGIAFSNITEIRIVNTYCNNNGTEVKSSIIQNGSNWAYATWTANLTGSNTKYSVYYSNPTNPAKNNALIADSCEFDNNICNFVNSTAAGKGINWKIVNSTGGLTNAKGYVNLTSPSEGAIYSRVNISAKNVLIKENNYFSSGDIYQIGISNETTGAGTSSQAIFYGAYTDLRSGWPRHEFQFSKNGVTSSAIFNSNTADYGANRWGIYWFKVNSTLGVNGTWYNTTNMQTFTKWTSSSYHSKGIVYSESNLHLGIYALSAFNTPQIIDYIRAYEKESNYVTPAEMPTFSLGTQESK